MAKRSDTKNTTLNSAKKAKNDEFYTQMPDIVREVSRYMNQLKGKVIFCNCDDPYESYFCKYFAMKFNDLGLKKLIATCYAGCYAPDGYSLVGALYIGGKKVFKRIFIRRINKTELPA